jgi:hypothetical protein
MGSWPVPVSENELHADVNYPRAYTRGFKRMSENRSHHIEFFEFDDENPGLTAGACGDGRCGGALGG